MNIRNTILPFSALIIAILLFHAIPASAQVTEAVRVISLSKSGYEQAFGLTYSSDGEFFAVGGSSGIYLFDAQNLSQIKLIPTNARARSVTFVPGSNLLAAGLFDNTIKLWQIPEGRLITTFQGHQGWVRSISVSADGSSLASASDDNTVRIWKVPDGAPLLTLDQNTQGVRAVALSPDGQLVAAALGDKTVRVWSVARGELLYTLTGHTDWVRCLTFSPDGSLLASGSFDMTVRLWEVSDGKLLETLKGHTSSILKVAFSPDGKTLASSSVDETVRLWQTSDGNPIRVLTGYSDFIYALSFSPDGKTLASGGGDNAIRVWDLDALGAPAIAAATPGGSTSEIQSTTPDCRQCHHRQGQSRPPRVLDLGCEGCHAGGIAQSFCIAFPRSANVGPLPIAYQAVQEISGLPVPGNEIAVTIAAPGNGETMYVRGSFMAPELVSGRVSYADPESVTQVEVRLDIVSGGQTTATLTTNPTRDGTFTFNVAINPGSPTPQLTRPATKICLVCHGDFVAEAGLPKGTVRLVVTATAPDSQRATDERWIRVDSSGEAGVPVEVKDGQTGEPISGLSVEASTIIYQWRDRFGSAMSGEDGRAELSLEELSQAPTAYSVSIPPQVLNGILYSSQPAQVELQPGMVQSPPVGLQASAQQGKISGTLEADEASVASRALRIWAIQSPAGPAYQVSAGSDGAFAFSPIPVASYILTPDLFDLATQGLIASQQQVELMQSPQTSAAIHLGAARPLVGSVEDTDGHPAQFAWAQINGEGSAYPVDPASGQFLISDVPDDTSFVTVNAPGYYSQSQHLSTGQNTMSFQLVAEPEAQRVGWGTGQVVIPSQTDATVSGSHITLQRGWLWGHGEDAQPLILDVDGTQITVPAGEFAVEKAASGLAWLYVRQGKADVLFSETQIPIALQSGQMLALVPSAAPLPMEGTVALALHPALLESPVLTLIEPSFTARLQNWLEEAGIGTAQTITFITYFLSLVALFATPFLVLFWIKRRNNAASQEKH